MSTVKKVTFVLLAISIILGSIDNNGFAQDTEPIDLLMITGGGPWHDYKVQKDQIKKGLKERISNINITTDYEGRDTNTMESTDFKFSRHLKEDWAADFDVVIYNHCNLQVKDENYVKEIVSEHVEHQVPAVMLHCPIHLYQFASGNAPKVWWSFTGAVSYVHEKENHPNTRPYTIQVLEPKHPIMRNYPRSWRTPTGELYLIVELHRNAEPLSHAFSVETQSYTETAWTHTYKGVRVFTSSLGHHNEAMGSDVNLNLIASGVLWAANKLEEDGLPVQEYKGERGLGWISLLDNQGTLNGWIENGEAFNWSALPWSWYNGNTNWPTNDSTITGESFSRMGDTLVVEGDNRTLFYDGRIAGARFKNFEFKADVYTYPESAAGIYFHTRYEEGDPILGYEARINASNSGSKTGSLVGFKEVSETSHQDEKWFTFHVKFEGNKVTVRINGEVVNEYTEPEHPKERASLKWGTIGIKSMGADKRVYLRNPMVRLLPD